MQNLFKNREMLLGLIIIGMILSFTTRAPNFASPENLANIFNDTSILIILALGQMVVILTKSIDLSVAANLAFTGMAVAMLDSAYPGLPLALLVLVAIGIGAALGAFGMAIRAQTAGRLGQHRQQRSLGRGQLQGRLAQVRPAGCRHALKRAAERCAVQVDLQDVALGQVPFQLQGAP